MTDFQGLSLRQVVKVKVKVKVKVNEKITVKRGDRTILKITPEIWHLIFVPI